VTVVEDPPDVVPEARRRRRVHVRLPKRLRLPARPRPTPRRRVVTGVIVCTAVVAAWAVIYGVVLSSFQEWRDQHVGYDTLREQLAEETAPLGGLIRPGAPVALLSIPALELHDLVVVEGTTSGDLIAGPGHRRDTPLPGQAGVSVVYGRESTFGGPFENVGTLARGDAIAVVTGQGRFTYRVIDIRRAGDRFPQPVQPGHGRLTLVSAEGASWRSVWAPTGVVYVDADLAGTSVPAPPGRPAAVPAAEQAMSIDTSVLVQLVLWLFLLVAVASTYVVSWVYWGTWQTWVVGVPALLACLWGVTSVAVQLMPNLM